MGIFDIRGGWGFDVLWGGEFLKLALIDLEVAIFLYARVPDLT